MFNNIHFWEGLYGFFILLSFIGIFSITTEGFFIIRQKLFNRILYFRVKRRLKRNPELSISEDTIRLVMLEELDKM